MVKTCSITLGFLGAFVTSMVERIVQRSDDFSFILNVAELVSWLAHDYDTGMEITYGGSYE